MKNNIYFSIFRKKYFLMPRSFSSDVSNFANPVLNCDFGTLEQSFLKQLFCALLDREEIILFTKVDFSNEFNIIQWRQVSDALAKFWKTNSATTCLNLTVEFALVAAFCRLFKPWDAVKRQGWFRIFDILLGSDNMKLTQSDKIS